MTDSTLIESYFTVNEEDLSNFTENMTGNLVEPFCITEPGVLIFNLAVNFASEDSGTLTPNVLTMLLIDGVAVAQSRVNDDQETSNVSLFYEGTVLADE